jgi:hypothetical protein
MLDGKAFRRWREVMVASREGQPLDPAPESPSPIPDNAAPTVLACDIARCLWHSIDAVVPANMSGNEDEENNIRNRERERLSEIVVRSLSGTDHHYYQGLHELLSIVTLSAVGEHVNDIVPVTRNLVRTHLSPFCTRSLELTEAMLYAMHYVLVEETGGGRMVQMLEASGVAPESHYAISWLLTWFAHVTDDVPTLQKLFDFLLPRSEKGIIFICAAAVLKQEAEVLNRAFADRDTTTIDDFGIVYATMSSLPRWTRDGAGTSPLLFKIDEITELAGKLYRRWSQLAEDKIQEFLSEKAKAARKQREHPRAGEVDSVGLPEPTSRREQMKLVLGIACVLGYSALSWSQPGY